MQLKKKDVQMAIQETALELFYQKGYLKTKMSDIAKEMDMSVGNIYTYFKNKEELFYTIITPDTIDYIEETIISLAKVCNDYRLKISTEPIDDAVEKHIRILANNYREVVIMLDRSEGTVYELTKHFMIERIFEERNNTIVIGSYIDGSWELKEQFYKIVIKGIFEIILMGLKEEVPTSEERYELCLALFYFQVEGKL